MSSVTLTCTPTINTDPKSVTFLNLEQFSITLSRDGTGGVLFSFGPETLTILNNGSPANLPISLSFFYEVDTGGTVVSDAIEIINPYTLTNNNSTVQITNEPLPIVTPTGTIQNMSFFAGVGQSVIGPPAYPARLIGNVGGTFINCLGEGTPILTPSGYRPIETIQEGDLILTGEGQTLPVLRKSFEIVSKGAESARMFRVPAGRFGATQDFLVSKWHKIWTGEEGWVEAYRCGLAEIDPSDTFPLYHLQISEDWKSHSLIAAGCKVESWSGVKPVKKTVAISDFAASVQSREFILGRDHLRAF
jgi:hypothetical protein